MLIGIDLSSAQASVAAFIEVKFSNFFRAKIAKLWLFSKTGGNFVV